MFCLNFKYVGTYFLYTTHGYALLNAVAEAVTEKKVEVLLKEMFVEMGLRSTYLDENAPLIYHRAR